MPRRRPRVRPERPDRSAPRRERLAMSVRSQRIRAREKMRQGAYLLPSALTLGSVFLSFWAVVLVHDHGSVLLVDHGIARQNAFWAAAWLLFAAFVCDGLDGKVARLTGTSSEFGVQLDSLADVLSFGLAPAILSYSWALHPFGRLGWLVAFLFLICGACRLARFNVQTTAAPDKRYFTGLPIPVAALTIAALVLNFPALAADSPLSYAVLALVAVLAFLMVSRIKYRSFKDVDFRRKRNFRTVAVMATVLVSFALNPQLMILALMGVFILSGPVARVIPERFRSFEEKASSTIEGIVGERDEESPVAEVPPAASEPAEPDYPARPAPPENLRVPPSDGAA